MAPRDVGKGKREKRGGFVNESRGNGTIQLHIYIEYTTYMGGDDSVQTQNIVV